MSIDPIKLTQELIRFETINPPGNETPCAEYIGAILESAGFDIAYYPLAENRANLIARIGGSDEKKPLCLSGHTDVVPLGGAPWSVAPFAGDISGGKIYGRGSTDMKGGVAAIIASAVELAPHLAGTPGLVLVITAAEERGCQGANYLASLDGVLGEAGAMIVAEPTSNRALLGHKGVLWVQAEARGITAHGSMPDKGDNAIYKAAHVISKLAELKLHEGRMLNAGLPTLNVGRIQGGMNINSIPDRTVFEIDIRMVPGLDPDDVMAQLKSIGGGEVEFTKMDYHSPVWSEPSNPWIRDVFQVMTDITGDPQEEAIATYFTDAHALCRAYGNPPTLILGPGEADMAHQTDEYCLISRIEEATAAFTEITKRWCAI